MESILSINELFLFQFPWKILSLNYFLHRDLSILIIKGSTQYSSTYDIFGLSWDIVEHIATRIESVTLFAIQFHELTCLAEELQKLEQKGLSIMKEEECTIEDSGIIKANWIKTRKRKKEISKWSIWNRWYCSESIFIPRAMILHYA